MRLTIILLAVLGIACGGSTETESPVGAWQLRLLNGTPLPIAQSASSAIIADTLTLNSNGTFNQRVTTGDFANGLLIGTSTQEFPGVSWHANGSALALSSMSQGTVVTLNGSYHGDTLTIGPEPSTGSISVFTR